MQFDRAILRLRGRAGFLPKLVRDRQRVDVHVQPPIHFIAAVVKLSVMDTAQRDRELVADLFGHRHGLCEFEMMRVRGRAAADKARLAGNEAQMLGVALAFRERNQSVAM